MSDIKQTLRKLHNLQLRTMIISELVVTLRALIAASLMMSVWLIIEPSQTSSAMILGAGIFLLTLLSSRGSQKFKKIETKSMLFALEIDHSDTKTSAFALESAKQAPDEWQEPLQKYFQECQQLYKKRLNMLLSTLVIPTLFLITILTVKPHVFQSSYYQFLSLLDYFQRGAVLTIESGRVDAADIEPIKLSRSQVKDVKLLEENMLKLDLRGFPNRGAQTLPTIELREDTEGRPIFQTFQTNHTNDTDSSYRNYSLKFSVSKSLLLVVPSISAQPLARFDVKKRPTPEVTLKSVSIPQEPWPDDKPLRLSISVRAKNPLQLVRLLIFSGQKRSQELVTRIVADDKTEFDTVYNLILEPYVDADLSQVEIIAEAIDRATPTPMVGQSKPLSLKTASAYGRYRQVLRHLRDLKSFTDQAIEENESQLSPEANKPAQAANLESANTPFFDGLDRSHISSIYRRAQKSIQSPNRSGLLQLSEQLNEFLFEHETLDDRERDRDFFVAARGLSRVLVQKKSKRPVSVEDVTTRIRSFLKERQIRWDMRTKRLERSSWPKNTENVLTRKPFQASMSSLAAQSEDAQRDQALDELTSTINSYREWIESLEKAEDQQRKQKEQQRQKGLADARNELKELQKVQGEISKQLDQADQMTEEQLGQLWPKARSQQNSNVTSTKRLEGKLRSLSPQASERIQAAVKEMQAVLETGNGDKFVEAESHSDFASRLLRQAESAARKSQNRQQRRSRGRRRQVSGDNYHGQAVVGGDVKVRYEYQVDRRYREDILDEAGKSELNSKEAQILDNYLRRVVR